MKELASQNQDLLRIKEEKENTPSSAEEYLDQMCQEKDLSSLLHFC